MEYPLSEPLFLITEFPVGARLAVLLTAFGDRVVVHAIAVQEFGLPHSHLVRPKSVSEFVHCVRSTAQMTRHRLVGTGRCRLSSVGVVLFVPPVCE